MTTPTLLFVHGAWHNSSCWNLVTSLLQRHGYRCLTPQIQFAGTAEPVDSLEGSINQLRTLIKQETLSGNDVYLVNHSFGGSVGCSSVKGLTQKDPSCLASGSGKVIGIIQICAFTPPSGLSLYDALPGEKFHSSDSSGWEVIDNGEPEDIFYNDIPRDEARAWKEKLLVKQSAATFKDRDNIYAGWQDVPLWYLFCKLDKAIPIQAQEGMIAAVREAGASVTTKYLESAHSPFLSRPEETAAFILEAVESGQK